MKQVVNPKDTSRAKAFDLWMSSPMPMVTLVKTLDVSRIVKMGKRGGYGFNVLLCWCIGKAACGHTARFLEELQKTINFKTINSTN